MKKRCKRYIKYHKKCNFFGGRCDGKKKDCPYYGEDKLTTLKNLTR
jgi:hypothetical protein